MIFSIGKRKVARLAKQALFYDHNNPRKFLATSHDFFMVEDLRRRSVFVVTMPSINLNEPIILGSEYGVSFSQKT